jgi:MFS family permease
MMFLAGTTEVTLAQWSSAYVERVFEIPKIFGDLSGIAMFALFMSLGRTTFGIWGKRLNLNNIMLLGAVGSALCYLIIALCPITPIVLIAYAMSGLFVCLLWPGTLSLTSERFPLAGAWMFAILAAGGDIGASVGPWFLGFVADNLGNVPYFANLAQSMQLNIEQIGLKGGILICSVFPILAFILLWFIKLNKTKINKEDL